MAATLKARKHRLRVALLLSEVTGLVGLAVFLYLKFGGSGETKPSEPVPTWESIATAGARGDRKGVEKRLALWLDAYPDDGKGLLTLAGLKSTERRYDEARAAIGRIKLGDPSWTSGQMMLGQIEMTVKNATAAEAAFRTLADHDPAAVAPRKALIYLYSLESRVAEARTRLWELYRIDPQPAALADLTRSIFDDAFDVRAMGPDLESLAKASPDDPFLQANWGLALYWKGEFAKALPYLEAAALRLENDPTSRLALFECRKTLGVPSKETNAEEVFGPDRTYSKAEKSYRYRLEGELANSLNQPKEALALFQKAVDANPLDMTSRYRLIQTFRKLSRDDKNSVDELRGYIARWEVNSQRDSALKSALRHFNGSEFNAKEAEHIADLCRDRGLLAEERAWREWALTKDPTLVANKTRIDEIPSQIDVSELPIALARPIRRDRSGEVQVRKVDAIPANASNVRFEEIAEKAGVHYTYDSGAKGDLFIVDTMGGGVGLFDYDADGWLDIYFVNGCRLPIDETKPISPNKLYRNKQNGTFEDVTEKAGVGGHGYGMGCTVGDYDNDGHDDLFVTGFGQTVLYRNRGDGTFEDVTAKSGVGSNRWSTAAGFGDLDHDGDLDLFVVTYVEADPKTAKPCRDNAGGAIHCSPGYFEAQFDQLFRNNGDGTFTDVSKDSGIEVANGRGLGLAVIDLDSDGYLDLFVANDASPNFAFRNLGNLKFEEVGFDLGLGADGTGKATASMGVVAYDLNSDGLIDLFHTNFLNEGSTLRLNLGKGLFMDATAGTNLDVASRSTTGFGAAVLDLENDGHRDLFVANGHVDDQVWVNSPMAQKPHLFANQGKAGFRPLGAEVASYFGNPNVGRGVAVGDLDNDGRTDLVIVHRDRPASILRNVTKPVGNWLAVDLIGTKSGHTPVGAKVILRAGGKSWTDWVTSGTSYLSTNDRRLHFGVGSAAKVDAVEIEWPSGRSWKYKDLPVNQIVTFTE